MPDFNIIDLPTRESNQRSTYVIAQKNTGLVKDNTVLIIRPGRVGESKIPVYQQHLASTMGMSGLETQPELDPITGEFDLNTFTISAYPKGDRGFLKRDGKFLPAQIDEVKKGIDADMDRLIWLASKGDNSAAPVIMKLRVAGVSANGQVTLGLPEDEQQYPKEIKEYLAEQFLLLQQYCTAFNSDVGSGATAHQDAWAKDGKEKAFREKADTVLNKTVAVVLDEEDQSSAVKTVAEIPERTVYDHVFQGYVEAAGNLDQDEIQANKNKLTRWGVAQDKLDKFVEFSKKAKIYISRFPDSRRDEFLQIVNDTTIDDNGNFKPSCGVGWNVLVSNCKNNDKIDTNRRNCRKLFDFAQKHHERLDYVSDKTKLKDLASKLDGSGDFLGNAERIAWAKERRDQEVLRSKDNQQQQAQARTMAGRLLSTHGEGYLSTNTKLFTSEIRQFFANAGALHKVKLSSGGGLEAAIICKPLDVQDNDFSGYQTTDPVATDFAAAKNLGQILHLLKDIINNAHRLSTDAEYKQLVDKTAVKVIVPFHDGYGHFMRLRFHITDKEVRIQWIDSLSENSEMPSHRKLLANQINEVTKAVFANDNSNKRTVVILQKTQSPSFEYEGTQAVGDGTSCGFLTEWGSLKDAGYTAAEQPMCSVGAHDLKDPKQRDAALAKLRLESAKKTTGENRLRLNKHGVVYAEDKEAACEEAVGKLVLKQDEKYKGADFSLEVRFTATDLASLEKAEEGVYRIAYQSTSGSGAMTEIMATAKEGMETYELKTVEDWSVDNIKHVVKDILLKKLKAELGNVGKNNMHKYRFTVTINGGPLAPKDIQDIADYLKTNGAVLVTINDTKYDDQEALKQAVIHDAEETPVAEASEVTVTHSWRMGATAGDIETFIKNNDPKLYLHLAALEESNPAVVDDFIKNTLGYSLPLDQFDELVTVRQETDFAKRGEKLGELLSQLYWLKKGNLNEKVQELKAQCDTTPAGMGAFGSMLGGNMPPQQVPAEVKQDLKLLCAVRKTELEDHLKDAETEDLTNSQQEIIEEHVYALSDANHEIYKMQAAQLKSAQQNKGTSITDQEVKVAILVAAMQKLNEFGKANKRSFSEEVTTKTMSNPSGAALGMVRNFVTAYGADAAVEYLGYDLLGPYGMLLAGASYFAPEKVKDQASQAFWHPIETTKSVMSTTANAVMRPLETANNIRNYLGYGSKE